MGSLRLQTCLGICALNLFACSSDSGQNMAPATGETPNPSGTAATGGSAPATGGSGVPTGVGGSGAAGKAAPAAGSGAPITSGSAGKTGAAGTASPAAGSGGTGTSASAGTSGSAGTSSAGTSGGAAGSGGDTTKPPCVTNSADVVFVGDSYINYDIAHTLLSTLIEQRAVKDGALMMGQMYTNYAIPGTALAAANLLGDIPPQWDMAKAADPNIKLVIMDGGGNDVLLDNMQCLAAGSDKDATCQQVVADANAAGSKMLTDMKASGVSDVIWFFYPHVPMGGDDINDYSLKMLQSNAMAMTTDTFHVFVVDTIPIFTGHDDWFASDGIHANDMGENAIADAIYKVMKDNCLGQQPSSMCCAP
jgi:hypothetical protein